MWSEKLKNGKYKFTERYRDPMTGKLRKISIVKEHNNDHTRKAAQRDLEKKINSKTESDDICSRITFGELISAYMESQKHETRESTYRRNSFQMKAMERILGSDTLVKSLTASYVRDSLISTGESNGRMNERLTRFCACIRWGVRNDKVKDASWLEKIGRFPDKSEREKVEGKYLEADELKKLLESMTEIRWKLLTEFLALTGLRIGEALALDNSDVDTDALSISVAKTCNLYTGSISPFTKTAMSTRDVHIQPELLSVIREIKTEMLKQRMAFGYAKTDYFFTDYDGARIHYNTYDKYLKENTLKVIGRKLTPHALRHTHTSLLAASGVSLEAISRRLGHADSDVTKRIYLHVTEKMKEKDDAMMDAVNIL